MAPGHRECDSIYFNNHAFRIIQMKMYHFDAINLDRSYVLFVRSRLYNDNINL